MNDVSNAMTEVIVTVDCRKQIETLLQGASRRDFDFKQNENLVRTELSCIGSRIQTFESELARCQEIFEEARRD